MAGLEPSEIIEISGNTYTVRRLPFVQSRKVYDRLKRVLQFAFTDDKLLADGASPFMLAGLAGGVSDEDLEFYCNAFGDVTTVDVPGEQAPLSLKAPAVRERLFGVGGNFEDVFVWLDFAVQVNFAGAIAKMRGALQKAEARAKEEAALLAQSQKASTGSSGASSPAST